MAECGIDECFTSKMVDEIKKTKCGGSELLTSMKKVTRFTGFFIVPLGVLLFIQAFFFRGEAVETAVIATSAGLLGMLPKGLVLLISIGLAVGVIRLSGKNVLVRDLHSLENLAHCDVVCLDKTGTLTEGSLKAESVFSDINEDEFNRLMATYIANTDDNNSTYRALCERFSAAMPYDVISATPFSSERKWSSVTLADGRTLILGAPEKLCRNIPVKAKELMARGKRILLAAAATAELCGVKNAERLIDASELTDDELICAAENNTVFGRVTPKQKKVLIAALQSGGHRVAMTGDGVNDLLAMRQADCSAAMGNGSDAAKQTAQLVLLNSDFAVLRDVISEGRRVINNLTKSAGVFFIKTIYSVLLSVICLLFNTDFPFIPIQITLIDAVIEAFPAFFMSFEKNDRRVEGSFLGSALGSALPNSIAIVLCCTATLFAAPAFGLSRIQTNLIMYIVVGIISLAGVVKAGLPFNPLRAFLSVASTVGFFCAVILFAPLLQLPVLTVSGAVLLSIVAIFGVSAAILLKVPRSVGGLFLKQLGKPSAVRKNSI